MARKRPVEKRQAPIAVPTRKRSKKGKPLNLKRATILPGDTTTIIPGNTTTSTKNTLTTTNNTTTTNGNNVDSTSLVTTVESTAISNLPCSQAISLISPDPSETLRPLLPWELDPKWGIKPAPEGTRTLAFFCSKYKPPKGAIGSINPANDPPSQPDARTSNRPRSGSASSNRSRSSDKGAGPQVQIVNGEIVILESSLYVDGQRKTTEELDEELLPEIHEDDTQLNATYGSFRHVRKAVKWGVEDTKQFYFALRQCGTDFEMMAKFFKKGDKDRKHLKKKYKKELRFNEHLVDLALSNRLELDLSVFEVDVNNVSDKPNMPTVEEQLAIDAAKEAKKKDQEEVDQLELPEKLPQWDIFNEEEEDTNDPPQTDTPHEEDILFQDQNEFAEDFSAPTSSLDLLPGITRTKKKKKFKANLAKKPKKRVVNL